MAKALKIVGVVVAVVAVVATAGSILLPAAAATATAAATAGGIAGISAATLATVGTIAGLAAAGIGIASSVLFKPSFTSQGNPQAFQTNPQSGLPYAIGRTRNSGLRIYAETSRTPGYNKADDLLWFGVMLSAGGAIGGIEKFTADNELITFNGSTGNGNGKYANWMAQKVWAGGLMASALALSLNGGIPPDWTSAHKLSGITHALWGLRYDAKDGAYYSAGVPQPAWIGRWVLVYDPRLDSSYPGGSGAVRPLQENTYVWSRNPALHALTWALGRWQNGKRTLGIGAPLANIRVSDFVEAANIADTNGWGCGGVEYSTDSKWDVLKRMLQAGGAIPTMTGAMIGCRVNKPRIAVATIRSADLLDEFSGAVTKPRRDRFNTVIPRYRSEDHEWEVISGKPISVAAYVTQDGGIRQKEVDYPLVQAEIGQGYDGNKQAGQLAAYDIVNSREAGPIKWTTGPKFIGLKTGDCVMLDVPDEGFLEQPVIITSVALDPSTGKVSFTAETETNSKHAFALGTSAVPPPPFALTPPNLTPPTPNAADWTLVPGATSDGLPVIRMSGGAETPDWDRVIVQYRLSSAGAWTSVGTYPENGGTLIEIAGVDSEKSYVVRLAYQKGNITGDWRELPAVTTPASGLGPLSGNLLRDSIFANGEAVGWSFIAVGGVVATGGINLGTDEWRPPGENTIVIHQPNAGSSGYAEWWTSINVEAGLWYEASVYAALHRCPGTLYLTWFNAGGGVISAEVAPITPAIGGTQLADYTHASAKGRAPIGASHAFIVLRKFPTDAGQADSAAFFTRPQIVQTTENAPSPVPYSPSGVGTKGEDGISPLLITVNPPSLALQGTATGIPMAGQLPRSVQVSAMRGGLDKAITSISVTGTSGCAVSVSGSNLTFTSVNPGGGFATINVTSDGETISGIKVPVTVGVGGTDAATSLAMSYSGAVTSSTYVALGDPVAMNANASGQLRVSASSTYYATYPTIATLAIKLQVSIDGGAWTDIAGAEDIGAPTSVEPPSSTYPGAAVISPVLASGLGANKPCQVRMLIRKNTAANASSSASRLLVEKT